MGHLSWGARHADDGCPHRQHREHRGEPGLALAALKYEAYCPNWTVLPTRPLALAPDTESATLRYTVHVSDLGESRTTRAGVWRTTRLANPDFPICDMTPSGVMRASPTVKNGTSTNFKYDVDVGKAASTWSASGWHSSRRAPDLQ
jgi:hypothetical protein